MLKKGTKLQQLGMNAHGTPPKAYAEQGASSREDYADPKRFKYPLMDAEHVRNAASRFGEFGTDYPPAERRAIALKIIRAARKFNINVDPGSLVGKLAGLKQG